MHRLLSLTIAVLGALALSACGFTPLYAVEGVSPGLSAIEVRVPQGRTAFLLGESLDDAFARNREAPPAYRLDVTLSARSFSRGLNLANTAKYFEGQLTTHYQLIEIATGKVLKTGSQSVEVSYAAADQPYPGVSAEQDAQQREADEAAQRIRIDIASYFAEKSTPTPTP
jgi:LPS-assembly lipoprotein